ncbi:acyl-CoA thioesterase [Corynebacterium sp. ES2794-CONJ1]|uniref:acyl-CoA thioesterase n=1 Tax=unclassified Corynebacterium TaxID=2624378 RepID=UPI002167D5B7|nr:MULTISPECIES: acyl-CoA thioesterase [unclassified Corynebacterium]MCS4490681.1 acyl-CoA thioesterase [Corynebacterium sp. ES2775-CONJ]MCS4492483.1 acyl-CoA thioesterase [Corynebacterium sp. ES2715-CONJ3]MCS4532553.1 acyl-CoA thioesterase [Corynebacterium sp. ES2730-CONJ]MCU9519948.1 acyl-CoA thioesterase [Corynebacterium sp. ES2794-CONJ1]
MTSDSHHGVHIEKIPTRWGDFDQFHHITNSAYIELAQEARLIYAQREFGKRGLDIPAAFVRKIEAEYLRPILSNTKEVTVETQVIEIGNTSFCTRQVIRDADGTVACTIDVVQVAVDIVTGSPRQLKDSEVKVLSLA